MPSSIETVGRAMRRCGAHYVVTPYDYVTMGRIFGVKVGEVVRVVKVRISGIGGIGRVLVQRAKRRSDRAMFPWHLRRVKGPVR